MDPTDPINLLVDTGVQSCDEKGGKMSVIVDAGGAYIIGRNVQLDFGIGTGAPGETPPPDLGGGLFGA